MHRQSGLTAGFVGFTSGGVRSLVDEIDDKTGMQEMKGSQMFGEARDRIESPQNYGFTSVVMKADKGKDGKIEQCAEAYINYIGGNRSFPICSVMDDRRYRLKELKPGDVAFYDHQQQQFHFNEKGAFLTGIDTKKIRMSLLKVEDEQQQSGGGVGASTRAEGGGTSGGESGGGQKKKGQKQRYEKAEKESKRFVDLNEKNIGVAHDADIGIKAGKTLATEGQAIKRKAEAHYFDGDVHITGNLYISKQGFKPTGPEWAPGTATPGPSDDDDVAAYVKRPPIQLTAEQLTAFERQRAFFDKIQITDDGVLIDGDLAVNGNLTVTGVVRAKDFEKINA
jgi:phage gp45-like